MKIKVKVRKTYFQKLNTWLWVSALILIIVVFSIGTFYDYQIETKIFDEDNRFGLTFDYFGKIAFLIPFNFFAISLITHLRINHKRQKVAFNFVYLFYCIIVITAPLLWIGEPIIRTISRLGVYELLLVPFVYIAFLLFELIYIIGEPDWLISDQKIVGKIILAFFLIIIFILFTQVLKAIFSRPRPYDVFSGIYEYREWWRINYKIGFGLNKSFPSGHVASAMCMITPTIVLKRSSQQWYSTWIAAMIFVILVAISRMVVGAHYLTDVTASIFFCLFWLYFGSKIKEYFIEDDSDD